MKKILFTAAAALIAFTVSAQEYQQTRTGAYRTDAGTNAYNSGDTYRTRTDGDAYRAEGNNSYVRTREAFRTEKSRWAVGPQIGIYMNTDMDGAVFGVGAYGRYSITNHWRVQPAVTALFEKNCSVDVSADIQYLFQIARRWDIYPQVGVGANDFGDWSCGIDFGVGTDFAVSRRWDVTASFKWIVQTASNRNDPFLINIGASYRF